MKILREHILGCRPFQHGRSRSLLGRGSRRRDGVIPVMACQIRVSEDRQTELQLASRINVLSEAATSAIAASIRHNKVRVRLLCLWGPETLSGTLLGVTAAGFPLPDHYAWRQAL